MRSVHVDCVCAEEWPVRLLGMFTSMTFATRKFVEVGGLICWKVPMRSDFCLKNKD